MCVKSWEISAERDREREKLQNNQMATVEIKNTISNVFNSRLNSRSRTSELGFRSIEKNKTEI